jgi:hypothetical protein
MLFQEAGWVTGYTHINWSDTVLVDNPAWCKLQIINTYICVEFKSSLNYINICTF